MMFPLWRSSTQYSPWLGCMRFKCSLSLSLSIIGPMHRICDLGNDCNIFFNQEMQYYLPYIQEKAYNFPYKPQELQIMHTTNVEILKSKLSKSESSSSSQVPVPMPVVTHTSSNYWHIYKQTTTQPKGLRFSHVFGYPQNNRSLQQKLFWEE